MNKYNVPSLRFLCLSVQDRLALSRRRSVSRNVGKTFWQDEFRVECREASDASVVSFAELGAVPFGLALREVSHGSATQLA